MNLRRNFFCIIFIILLLPASSSAQSEDELLQTLSMQIDRLVALISEPTTFEESRKERYVKKFANYTLAGIKMSYVGGSGIKTYVAVFSNEPPIFSGMTVPPDWAEFDLPSSSINGGILTINGFDRSGEPPFDGKPVAFRFAIEDVNGWGLKYLPDIKKRAKK